jgi:pimeloyl-ACP methyl ester carboxylesterase
VKCLPSTDGVEVAVHDLGGDGPVVFFSHATGLHGMLWAPLARSLRGYHAVAVDYRGHGDSGAPARDSYDWSGFRDDALALVDHLHTEPLFGVGHSMGGAVLMMAELARPGTFAALAVYEPIVFPGGLVEAENPVADGARRRRPEFPTREAALANFSGKPPLDILTPEVLGLYVEHGFADTPAGTIRLKCSPETEARTFEGSARHDTFSRLGDIHCPVLVMSGPAADGRPAEIASEVARLLPQGELHTFERLGHFGPLEDPPAVAGIVAAFFAAI